MSRGAVVVVVFCVWWFGQWAWLLTGYLREVYLERKRTRCP